MRHAISQLRLAAAVLAAAFVLGSPALVLAEEGLWTLDNLPLDAIEKAYGFRPTAPWIEHVQQACVDFGGGSGAFVSPEGLVLTNHHVALGQLAKMSSAEHNYVADGFYAHGAAEEKPCPDLELRVLQQMENVTARVTQAIDPRAPQSRQNEQRKAAMARLSREAEKRTHLQPRVVELYHGGEYWLYLYRKYTDVRLVMAPEQGAAFYGGDPDNFSYPRHDVDCAFFRVYENGRPVHPQSYFRWRAAGPKDGDLVFVAGDPGSTSRQLTVSQLEYQRDCMLPVRLRQQEQRRAVLLAFSQKASEQARRAADRIFGLENNLKRQRAFLEILRDPAFMDRKRAEEKALRERAAGEPKAAAESDGAWERIAAAQQELRGRYLEYLYSDLGGRNTRLVSIANNIVRYVTEIAKPSEQRFPEFQDQNLESLRFQLFSRAPVYPDLEAAMLASVLGETAAALGPDNALVKAALGGRPAAEVAEDLTRHTKLADPAFRRALIQGGRKAVAASTDPLIVWARGIDPAYREIRRWYEDHVEGVESLEGARIARARFLLDGKSIYPDATGTLRLSYGKVAGYEQLTTRVPWKTTFYGLYDRAASFDDQAPFRLAPRVAAARERVDLATPLDFVCTDDIIGGNSGSPVIDRDLNYVGLIFDGNTQSFLWDYAYDDAQARSVAVHPAAILEALRKIYDMGSLADELAPATRAALGGADGASGQ